MAEVARNGSSRESYWRLVDDGVFLGEAPESII
jgi:hypothetical protein